MNGGSPLGAFIGVFHFQVSLAQVFTSLEALVEIQGKQLLNSFFLSLETLKPRGSLLAQMQLNL